MTLYADVSVIVDGALEETETFFDYAVMNAYVDTIKDDAEGHGYETQVFVLWHEHDLGECDCAQYVQDHRPTYVFNPKE